MTENTFRKEYIDFDLSREDDAANIAEKLAIEIAAKVALGWEDLKLEVSRIGCGYECSGENNAIIISGNRPETENEKKGRLQRQEVLNKRNNKAKKQIEEKELKELARLKEKYE